MDRVKLIWVDLREDPTTPGLCGSLPGCYQALRVGRPEAIRAAINCTWPSFLCFEYDYPSAGKLAALRWTRLSWPSLPVLMITVSHSEELALFALRARVWDYLVTPIAVENLCARFAVLSRLHQNKDPNGSRVVQSPPFTHNVARKDESVFPANRFGPALGFVERNLTEKISLSAVARLCGLGRFQFSRAFKQEQGTTFREFLVQRRINRAIQLLNDPKASVTDVAFAVGFNDLSYFARVFRRFTGVLPSVYRQKEFWEMARLPAPEKPQDGEPAWPIAKYSYPGTNKS